ncbi:MAG: hypothetical protein ACP5LM_04815 [Thermoplasmata archaeon]
MLIQSNSLIGHYNEIVDAIVVQIDPNNFILKTKDGQFIYNPAVIIPYYNPNINSQFGGIGMFSVPQVGEIYNVSFDKFGVPHVVGSVMNRYPNPLWETFDSGDVVILGQYNQRLRLANSGFVELYASNLNSIQMFRSNNLMRILAQRFDLYTDECALVIDKDIAGTHFDFLITDQPNGLPIGDFVHVEIDNSTNLPLVDIKVDKLGNYNTDIVGTYKLTSSNKKTTIASTEDGSLNFNALNEIGLSSNNDIKVSSSIVEIDAINDFKVKSSQIEIGNAPTDYAVLGNRLVQLLQDMIKTFNDILTVIQTGIVSPVGNCTSPTAPATLMPDIVKLNADIQTILSNTIKLGP